MRSVGAECLFTLLRIHYRRLLFCLVLTFWSPNISVSAAPFWSHNSEEDPDQRNTTGSYLDDEDTQGLLVQDFTEDNLAQWIVFCITTILLVGSLLTSLAAIFVSRRLTFEKVSITERKFQPTRQFQAKKQDNSKQGWPKWPPLSRKNWNQKARHSSRYKFLPKLQIDSTVPENEETLLNNDKNGRQSPTTEFVQGMAIGALATTAIGTSAYSYFHHRQIKAFWNKFRDKFKTMVSSQEVMSQDKCPMTAFVLHVNEQDWITNQLVPKMEVQWGWKLVLDFRDFIPGKLKTASIQKAIKESDITIILLNKKFLHNGLCVYGTELVVQKERNHGRDCAVLCEMESVCLNEMFPAILYLYVEDKRELKWPQDSKNYSKFWSALKRVLDSQSCSRISGSLEHKSPFIV